MFIGRKEETALLDRFYNSKSFEFLILYGRRRVGKTTLLLNFTREKNCIFFSAQEKNDRMNLADFSTEIQRHFLGSTLSSFDSWQAAFDFVGNQVTTNQRLTIIIDEFPYIASENPSIKSILQHTIDHSWKKKNIFLVLCGSSISFMQSEILGHKSPLHGRSTAQFELLPFDYLDSASFFPHYSSTEKLMAYGILGGTPRYLEAFDNTKSLEMNIAESILAPGSFLKDEPQTLLRMELRNPAVYNSILEAIANGASRLNDIAQAAHEESSKCSKYLITLRDLKLVKKVTPAGEDDSSRKTIYKISDEYLRFWYHFIFGSKSYLEMVNPIAAAKEIMGAQNFHEFMGEAFETICLQYMNRKAKNESLPFVPFSMGRWWGNNPKRRCQDDVDILALNKKGNEAIFCECKFRNKLFDKSDFEDLVCSSEIFAQVNKRNYYLFSASGFTSWIMNEATHRNDITLVTADDFFALP